MKLEFAAKPDAQAMCDRIHAWMIANNEAYAASVASGATTAWADPYQRQDEAGAILDPAWYVNVKPRCMGALTEQEKTSIK